MFELIPHDAAAAKSVGISKLVSFDVSGIFQADVFLEVMAHNLNGFHVIRRAYHNGLVIC